MMGKTPANEVIECDALPCGGLMVGIGALIAFSLPDLRRYMKISTM